MQTKGEYTPGPWVMAAKPSSVVGWPVVAQSGRVIASINYVQFSAIDPKIAGDDAFNRESQANARLIAAAPELLTKVEIAATIFDEYARLHSAKGTADGDQKAKRNLEYAADLRAAIARAKGLPS